MTRILLLLIIFCGTAAGAGAATYDVRDYGAVPGDTAVLASAGINSAIEACAAGGGGRVVVPAGKYRCGTIFMRDNVELHLENGAYLYATSGHADFPMQPRAACRSQKDNAGWNAFIYAVGCSNIAITGQGVIDGRGKGRKGNLKGVPGDGNGRPRNILMVSCRNVRISGITVRNSPIWNQHYFDCEDVVIDGMRSWNHCNGNNDGIDIDGCRRFILTNSIIDSDDDGIVLKSTGLAPCEDVIIRGCIVSSFANAIKCGTESVGGFRNIHVSDCIVKPSSHRGDRVLKTTPSGITAISLEVVDGGVMEHVTIDNILVEGTECPLFVRLADRGRRAIADLPAAAGDSVTGTLRDVCISNIRGWNCGTFGSSITGIPGHRVENIRLSDISIESRGGLARGNYRTAGDLNGRRHDMAGNAFPDKYWKDCKSLEEDVKGYPQPTLWGNLPCHGLFIRHARNVTLHNVSFTTAQPDPRKDIIAVDVEKLRR